ncbi:MAG: hypothetical protein NTZ01_02030, partial [Verrucomicrobia bacterium]|nr:hypothetical protein [Verrucomicrobiota bacterium]
MKTDSEHALGGIPIPVDRRKMKMGFWLATGALVYYLIFFNDAPIPLSRLGGSLLLVAAILLPAWLWVAGKAQGVPLYPLYCLFFFPTYAVPLCRGDSRFVEYTELQIANGVFTLAGFILLGTLVWHQCVNHNLKPKPMVRALDPAGSIGLMIAFLLVGIAFEFVGDLLGAFGGGLYQAGRGYAQNASRLAV